MDVDPDLMSSTYHGCLSPEVITMIALLPFFLDEDKEPIIQHDSALTGQDYYDELMQTENKHRFRDSARMKKSTFLALLDMLCTTGELTGGPLISPGVPEKNS